MEMDQISEYQIFKDDGKAKYNPKSKWITNAPQGYQRINVHLVFACKHDGHHKSRSVAAGTFTPDPIDSIYSGVVSTRSLRLSIFLAKLNTMEVWGADIGIAYLEATTKEKICIVAGPEFEELQGHILEIHKALHSLKSSGLRWSHRIYDIMLQLGFKPCKADRCVWLREMKTKYEYIAIYVYDLLIPSDKPQQIIKDLKEKFKLKIKGDGPLEYHLGCDYKLHKDNTLVAQPIKYINKILESYKKMYPDENIKAPLKKNDHPELDNTELCNKEQITKYMCMIGQLQWADILGSYDILSTCHVHVQVQVSTQNWKPREIEKTIWVSFKNKTLCH